MKEKFYITTPLYYPSGKWHLGHSYTTVCCDAIARYKRMSGYDVFYLTGTDEHGQKIEERAKDAGMTPKQFVDGLVDNIKSLWQRLDISYDKFIRTTDDYHVKSVQKIFTYLYEKGDIYKATYKGKYCVPCESFWTDTQLVDGKCPDCGRPVIDSAEESYFFRLSKYGDRIRKLLTETDFLEPKSRVNEMVNNFIDKGLNDLAVTRTSVEWGIPVPFDSKHKVYVWIDALSNYINALGYNGDEKLMSYWPANVHMVGKEIVRFHSIIWPAILMALDLPLPKKVYGHGWLLLGGDKMSKSKGNVADPFMLIDKYGVDAVRYYLLREVPFGSDGAFTPEAFLTRYNSDLANDLGNLVKRTLAMSRQYFGGKVTIGTTEAADAEFTDEINSLKSKVDNAIDKLNCPAALEAIFAVISKANKYIDANTPWVLFSKGETQRLKTVIYNLLESIRVCATLLSPFITKGTEKIFEGLNIEKPKTDERAVYIEDNEYNTVEQPALYLRVDIKKELKEMEEKVEKTAEVKEEPQDKKPLIGIEDFDKLDLRIAEVIACEKVEKADKLLKLTVRLGDEERTVVSGIAKSYTPEQMVGKKVVLVANLKPVKLRGIESAGMVICADCGDGVSLVCPEKETDSGAKVC